MELIIHLQKCQFPPPLYYRYKQIPSSSSYSYLYKLTIIVVIFFFFIWRLPIMDEASQMNKKTSSGNPFPSERIIPRFRSPVKYEH